MVYDKGKQIININRCRLGSSIEEEDHSVIDQVIKTTLANNDEICNFGEKRSGLSTSILSRYKRGTFISIPIRAGSTNLGALYIDNLLSPTELSASAVQFAKMMSQLASLAIENSLTESGYRKATGDPTYLGNRLEQEINRSKREGKKTSLFFLEVANPSKQNKISTDKINLIIHEIKELLDNLLRNYDFTTINSYEIETTRDTLNSVRFSLVISNADKTAAEKIAKRLISTLEESQFNTLTCKTGIAIYPDDAQENNVLQTLCDEALFMAKNDKTKPFVFASEIASKSESIKNSDELTISYLNRLSAAYSLKNSASHILNLLSQSLAAKRAFLVLYDNPPNETQIEYKALHNFTTEEFENSFHKIYHEIIKEAIHSRTHQLVEKQLVSNTLDNKMIMIIAQPLFKDNIAKGIVVLDRPSECGQFSDDQITIFKYIIKESERILQKESLNLSNIVSQKSTTSNRIESEKSPINVISSSPKTKKLVKTADVISQVDYPVVIQGAKGTGKLLISKYIHQNSGRRNGSFLVVDCKDLPDNAFDADSTFKVAIQKDKKDANMVILEACEGGTLVLRHIEELTKPLQKRILAIIEEPRSSRSKHQNLFAPNIRFLATTNCDLEKLVEQKKFRADLFNRLAIRKIEVHPLKERTEDIPLLADQYLTTLFKENIIPSKKLSADATDLLIKYEWPGNIPELYEELRTAALKTASDTITSTDLSARFKSFDPMHELVSEQSYLSEKLEKFEKLIILSSLKQSGNSIQKTAYSLGIDRSTLWRKLQKYNIEVEE
ncbi:MAG: sigma 54-interacting transcriptional regulator [Planctomycetes bacterium]|nr:sigma 54-interacting transcriptional regulator [Planctomycetota bacterium]